MKLQVITPDKGIELNQEGVSFLEAEGVEGQFGVLDGHLGFITLLKNMSVLRYREDSENKLNEIKIDSAILEVAEKNHGTEVKVLASKLISS